MPLTPLIFSHTHKARKGFTLVEMSVVIVIVGIVMGASMTVGNKWIEATRYRQTTKNMAIIDKAIQAYVRTNNRLPCPGPISTSYTGTTSLQGVELSAPGTCAATLAVSGNIAFGGLPTKTLDLPNSLSTDGWGRRIGYYVDIRMTNYDATVTYPVNATSGIGAITIQARLNDNTLVNRNSSTNAGLAVYALVSHGPNGHGAFLNNGSRYYNGSTNVDEWDNCYCNATTTTAFDDTTVTTSKASFLVQSSPFDTFDDIVTYKRRSQLWDKYGE